MSAPQPIAPFELEPKEADQLEVVPLEPTPTPVVVEGAMMPSTRRPVRSDV